MEIVNQSLITFHINIFEILKIFLKETKYDNYRVDNGGILLNYNSIYPTSLIPIIKTIISHPVPGPYIISHRLGLDTTS